MTRMKTFKILLSNLGYCRGIDGRLTQHIFYAHRHFYCTPTAQNHSLQQLNALIAREDPDICCFVEIDKGSFTSAGYNQIQALINEKYVFYDIENKYAQASRLRSFFITKGKSLAFIAKRAFSHEKLYFRCGTKRLIYKIDLDETLTLFFAHFSLNKVVREKQILQAGELMRSAVREVIFLGDFNILTGINELDPLLKQGPFVLLNREDIPTFTFHKHRLVLDLCICSKGIAERANLKVVSQPYSDHAALVLEVR
jgi:endonuclease/exonuclease/phosphatase family metal-dependent hydrolase